MRVISAFKTFAYRILDCAWRDTRGATAVEYGLIIALVVLVMVVGLTAVAEPTVGIWNTIATKVAEAR